MTRSVPIADDLADWLAEESERRTVGRRLLVSTAVRMLRDSIEANEPPPGLPQPIPSRHPDSES